MELEFRVPRVGSGDVPPRVEWFPDQESTDLDNYRPIGLLSMAYRIISKAITNRLQPMLSRLIRVHQYAYVNGRRSENIGRIISELMTQAITVPDFNILTLKLDFRKTFDSMSFQYINRFLLMLGEHFAHMFVTKSASLAPGMTAVSQIL